MLFIERLVNTPCFSTTENKRARTLFGAMLSIFLGPYMWPDKVKISYSSLFVGCLKLQCVTRFILIQF